MPKEQQLETLEKRCNECKACELGKTRNNLVFSDGSANAKILLIGEAPGAEEDATGKPFVGRAGKLLNQFFENAGISRENDIYICNTVKCRPPQNRIPTIQEKQACQQYLLKQIEIVNPQVVLLCGATAMQTFLSKKEKISQIRGQWLEILGGRKAMVIFHPSYLLRNHKTDEGSPRWLMSEDLKKIKEFCF